MTIHPGLQPCVPVTGSLLIFALLIERVRLMLAVIVTVLVSILGSRGMGVRAALIVAVCAAAAMALLFVGLLGQPFTLIAGR